MRKNSRRETHFPVVQTPNDFSYVPTPTRNEDLEAYFKSREPGIVIKLQQKIGVIALGRAYNRITADGDEAAIVNAANFSSLVTLGTAYHLFAEPAQDVVEYRRVELPRVFDEELDVRLSDDELQERIKTGLALAANLSFELEAMPANKTIEAHINKRLGQILARTGVNQAVQGAKITALRGSEKDIQQEAWQAAQRAYMQMIELTGKIEARPTLAQLPDEYSPFRKLMNDDKKLLSRPVHKVVLEEIERAKSQ
jgi:hypothetical protein